MTDPLSLFLLPSVDEERIPARDLRKDGFVCSSPAEEIL